MGGPAREAGAPARIERTFESRDVSFGTNS
jgi:hypothetical protein